MGVRSKEGCARNTDNALKHAAYRLMSFSSGVECLQWLLRLGVWLALSVYAVAELLFTVW